MARGGNAVDATIASILCDGVETEESFSVHVKSRNTIQLGNPASSGVILAYILRVLDGILPAPNLGLYVHRLLEAFKFGFG
ncbi:glutathione hydrolase 1 proenzyme-like isoform X1 [Aphis craccivora]|uniref:Glutathione hydrolase 1 proenzyme-like isoform X1 n=1 Tax=Aphis craccivora TaxID=307492 RepID=A0A6G0ZHR0_APHCR|nr:glutathione hydrolase 1 proenzyme-like isoform X1 [Aphis craccivora]